MLVNEYKVRLVDTSDSESILAIYKPYVTDHTISFEYEVPNLKEFTERIRMIALDYPYIVCLENDKIIGYAYASLYRSRRAYQWGVESTIYMHETLHGKGLARILYNTLFSMLKIQGYLNVYAVISLPNPKSIGFHKSLGFEEIGVFKNVGYKFNSWHDVQWMDLNLGDHTENVAVIKKWVDMKNSKEINLLLDNTNTQLQNL